MAHNPIRKKTPILRDAVSRFIESQKSATFNYRQVSAALGIGSISHSVLSRSIWPNSHSTAT